MAAAVSTLMVSFAAARSSEWDHEGGYCGCHKLFSLSGLNIALLEGFAG